MAGLTTIGAYRLVREIDAGPVSIVYRAEHSFLGTPHALKWLQPDQDEPIVEAMVLAARLQARVRHAHVVRATDGGLWEGRPYLVTEWIDGQTLAEQLDMKGALAPPFALAIFRGVVRGVQALHEARIVHRDLKPSNVLVEVVNQRLTPKVTDLGLCKEIVPGEKPTPAGLSRVYRTLGTPEYMAPEQVSEVGTVDERADLWSLGVLLYEMVTNEVPFDGSSPWAVALEARLGRYLPARQRAPHLSPALDAVIRDLLVVDPGARLPSCMELLRRLDAVS